MEKSSFSTLTPTKKKLQYIINFRTNKFAAWNQFNFNITMDSHTHNYNNNKQQQLIEKKNMNMKKKIATKTTTNTDCHCLCVWSLLGQLKEKKELRDWINTQRKIFATSEKCRPRESKWWNNLYCWNWLKNYFFLFFFIFSLRISWYFILQIYRNQSDFFYCCCCNDSCK